MQALVPKSEEHQDWNSRASNQVWILLSMGPRATVQAVCSRGPLRSQANQDCGLAHCSYRDPGKRMDCYFHNVVNFPQQHVLLRQENLPPPSHHRSFLKHKTRPLPISKPFGTLPTISSILNVSDNTNPETAKLLVLTYIIFITPLLKYVLT